MKTESTMPDRLTVGDVPISTGQVTFVLLGLSGEECPDVEALGITFSALDLETVARKWDVPHRESAHANHVAFGQ